MNKDTPIDRVENKSFNKQSNALLFLATFTSVLAVANFIILAITDKSLKFYHLSPLLISIIFILFYLIRRKKWGGQFIEWNEESVTYKGRGPKQNKIEYRLIEELIIKMDSIEFKLKDGTVNILEIEDYFEYEDRTRIKTNFEKLKKALPKMRLYAIS